MEEVDAVEVLLQRVADFFDFDAGVAEDDALFRLFVFDQLMDHFFFVVVSAVEE